MSEQQIEELMESGFSRDEAVEALNLSKNEAIQTKDLLKYMTEIKTIMVKLNELKTESQLKVESQLKAIHDESLLYQKLIQEKEKQLTVKIENEHKILKSKFDEKKQKYINLTSKLQTIKQSLVTGENKENEENEFKNIKQEMNEIETDKIEFLQSFNLNKLEINSNSNWYKIKDIINNIDDNKDEKKNENDEKDNNILSIDLMTFNIRNSLLDTKIDRLWNNNRRKLTANMLTTYGPPTIIATQEGVINQLIDIQNDLPSYYTNIGNGRLPVKWYNSSNDRMNEHCKIYWNNNILQIIDYGTFQLERPKDAPLPRVVTWSVYDFRNINIKYALLIVNTHLSYKTEEIRIIQLRHLMKFVVEFMNNYKNLYSTQLYNKELLIFIVGDFNSNNNNDSKLYEDLFDDSNLIDGIKINDHFIDCTKYCNNDLNCKFTFHAFNGQKYNKHITFMDWIICSKNVINSNQNAIKLKAINVITENEFNQGLPSDHYPVILKLDIDKTKCQLPQQKGCIIQ